MGLWDTLLDRTIYYSFDRSGFLRHGKQLDLGHLDVDMAGKKCLITGANSGLGLAATKGLARRGSTVILACRDESRGQQALEIVKDETGNKDVHLEIVDMSSLSSVRALVERLAQTKIDVLIHNAGLLPLERKLTDEGLELTVATHLVGPFLLNWLLQESLVGGRIIFVSSGGMYAKRLNVETMLQNDGPYDGVAAYAMTKRGQVVLAEMWAERLKENATIVSAMHPGWAKTPGVEKSLPRFWKRMQNRLRTPEEGADTAVWLAVSQAAAKKSGSFWFDRKEASKHMAWWTKENAAEQKRLWDMCRQHAGV